MKKLFLASVSVCITANFIAAYADNDAIVPYPSYTPLNQISLELSEEAWATTQTAKVIVGMNAELANTQLGSIHSHVIDNLKKIAGDAEWHITQFNRSKSDAGLEQIYIQAEARIPENQLANVRSKAKTVSKPGENYEIVAIQFTPSAAEIEQARADLRNKIYNEANAELVRVNKAYPNGQYYLHSINFTAEVSPTPSAVHPMMLGVAAGSAKEEGAGLAVSNKVKVTADVVLASMPQGKAAVAAPPTKTQ